jgi:hypothetical protein
MLYMLQVYALVAISVFSLAVVVAVALGTICVLLPAFQRALKGKVAAAWRSVPAVREPRRIIPTS